MRLKDRLILLVKCPGDRGSEIDNKARQLMDAFGFSLEEARREAIEFLEQQKKT